MRQTLSGFLLDARELKSREHRNSIDAANGNCAIIGQQRVPFTGMREEVPHR